MNNSLPAVLQGSPSFESLCKLLEHELSKLPLSVLLVYLIDLVQVDKLPVLAEQFSLLDDGWELAESEQTKRDSLKTAIELHKRKGTPWAVREVIRRFGFGEVELIENIHSWQLDGKVSLIGSHVLGDVTKHWAHYRVVLKESLTNDQAINLFRTIINVAPARCYLEELDYREAAFRLDGLKILDGKYTLGTIKYDKLN